MKTFLLYIKSHCDYPDYEQEVEAYNQKEAVEYFYKQLRGEYDREFLNKNVVDSDLINK